jgi:hypothetical protein
MDNKQQAPIGVVLECKVQSGHVEMPDGSSEWKEVRNWRVEVVSEIYLEPGTGVYTTPPAPVQHNTNAWADMAANGLQWVRNIVDGVSDPVVALANLEENLKHCEAAPTPPAAPVPEGWKHVPIEPTDEMLDAAQAVVKDIYRVDADRVYAAMLNNIPVAQEAAHGITKVQP